MSFLYKTVGRGGAFVFGTKRMETWSRALFNGSCLLLLPSPVCVPPSTVRLTVEQLSLPEMQLSRASITG